MKRIATHILIVLILCGVFCDGYFTISQLSSGRIWLADSEVYAADDWEAVTQDDLVTAFQYYCKSRNLTIDGSIADALTSFTTTTFNNICNTLGIDVNSLQANLKKTVEGNLGLRFLMNQQGVLAYNRIFAEFLQNNDLAVGDDVENKNVYDGYLFNFNDNNSLVYIVNDMSSSRYDTSNIYQFGSAFQFSYENADNYINNKFSFSGIDGASYDVKRSNVTSSDYAGLQTSINGLLVKLVPNDSYNCYGFGNAGIFIDHYNYIWLGVYSHIYGFDNKNIYKTNSLKYLGTKTQNNDSLESADVYITTNNNTINNNNYTNNYTIIYNDGDYYEDDDEPLPTTPPDGGGGGGGGDDPDQPSPSGPDLPDWGSPHGTGTIGSDGTFDFDIPFSLPDLNIDWSLKNIGQKFPFCIPSDIVSFYQVLAVEPEAPSIDAHIPLGSFYDWHFQADFAEYDNWARIIRIVEYVGFVITLIYFTVKLVKG